MTSQRAVAGMLIVLQGLQALSLVAWLFAAVFAGSALGEPGANAGTFAAVAGIYCYPVWLLGLAATSWVLLRRGSTGWALGAAGIATAPVIVLLVLTAVAA